MSVMTTFFLFSSTVVAGLILLIEFTYHYSLEMADGSNLKLFGVQADVATAGPWIVVMVLLAAGGLACWKAWAGVRAKWGQIQSDLAGAGR